MNNEVQLILQQFYFTKKMLRQQAGNDMNTFPISATVLFFLTREGTGSTELNRAELSSIII